MYIYVYIFSTHPKGRFRPSELHQHPFCSFSIHFIVPRKVLFAQEQFALETPCSSYDICMFEEVRITCPRMNTHTHTFTYV